MICDSNMELGLKLSTKVASCFGHTNKQTKHGILIFHVLMILKDHHLNLFRMFK